MSVLIKGIQKPDRCINCPFMISRDNDDCILQSDAANELFMSWDDMKLNCPLVELPEHHGDLIDRDALSLRGKLKLIEEREKQIYGGVSWSFVWCIAAIEDASAIIEAEGADG